jgi:hypothetical protein
MKEYKLDDMDDENDPEMADLHKELKKQGIA